MPRTSGMSELSLGARATFCSSVATSGIENASSVAILRNLPAIKRPSRVERTDAWKDSDDTPAAPPRAAWRTAESRSQPACGRPQLRLEPRSSSRGPASFAPSAPEIFRASCVARDADAPDLAFLQRIENEAHEFDGPARLEIQTMLAVIAERLEARGHDDGASFALQGELRDLDVLLAVLVEVGIEIGDRARARERQRADLVQHVGRVVLDLPLVFPAVEMIEVPLKIGAGPDARLGQAWHRNSCQLGTPPPLGMRRSGRLSAPP